ncbi:MAG: diguanylate cyclase (GGDEF)-like protein [Sulfurimonas sp.]|jgi:diguanylate cyclase (GGDEF)-like protein|uniref:GGDEF domain-containing protein n=1 Tax=Sulfurimonas sp. TaxID=2022749 RepID=UPI0039E4BE58
MKIQLMIRLLIALYVLLIVLVSYGIYNLNHDSKEMDKIRENRYSILLECTNLECSKESILELDKTKKEIDILRKDMDENIVLIFNVMFLAVFSFIFTYVALRRKVLQPIDKMNEIIIDYQNGKDDVKEFKSNNDEIGLMIREFFIMKRMLDDDYSKIEKLALTDPLTEIFNRRAFFEISEKTLKLSLRNHTTFSIMILDIDFFKKVNDVYGHLVGDDILKYLVKSVASEIRESDLLARFGGEEFIVMLPDTDENGALALAKKVRESIENHPYEDEKLSILVTVSIGVSELRGEKLLRELIKRADDALYAAKANGRNRVEVN